MRNRKIISMSILVIFSGTLVYAIFRHQNSRKEIKRIVKELQMTQDTLKRINSAYVLLETEYESVYKKLDSTRVRFNYLHNSIDSFSKSYHSGLSLINKDLRSIVQMEKQIKPFNNNLDTFRFK